MSKEKITIASLSLIACASVDPHENFKNILYRTVGLPLKHSGASESDLIATRQLPNGNIENKYVLNRHIRNGACKYFFEINPESGKIVAARYEGTPDECKQFP